MEKCDGLHESILRYRYSTLFAENFLLNFPKSIKEYNLVLSRAYSDYEEVVALGGNNISPPPPYKEI
jgi:hypothetical protein